MPDHASRFPENRFAENRSSDPDDCKNGSAQDSGIDQKRNKQERRFSRKEIEENLPVEPDPDDPVAP